MRSRTNSGFTLIELLVVIAILGLLAAIIMVSINSARTKARDSRRASDLAQISKALELYYSSHSSYPPFSNDAGAPKSNWSDMLLALQADGLISVNEAPVEKNSWIRALVNTAEAVFVIDNPTKISPQDPQYPDRVYGYMSDGTTYRIRAKLENPGSALLQNSLTGSFNTAGVITGTSACDKSLGYFCLGNGPGL